MLAPMRVLRLAKSIQSINQSNYMMVDTLFRPQGLFSKHMAGGGHWEKFCRGSAALNILPYPYASANVLNITPYENA